MGRQPRCTKCGADLLPGDLRCPACGEGVEKGRPAGASWAAPRRRSRAPLVVGIVAGVLVLGAGATIAIYLLVVRPRQAGPLGRTVTSVVSVSLPEAAAGRMARLVSPQQAVDVAGNATAASIQFGEHQLISAVTAEGDPVGFLFPDTGSTTVTTRSTAVALLRLALQVRPQHDYGSLSVSDLDESAPEVGPLAAALDEALAEDPMAIVDPPEHLQQAMREALQSLVGRAGPVDEETRGPGGSWDWLVLSTPAYAETISDPEAGVEVEWNVDSSNSSIVHATVTNYKKRWLIVRAPGADNPPKCPLPSRGRLVSLQTALQVAGIHPKGNASSLVVDFNTEKCADPYVEVYGFGLQPLPPSAPQGAAFKIGDSFGYTMIYDWVIPSILTILGGDDDEAIRAMVFVVEPFFGDTGKNLSICRYLSRGDLRGATLAFVDVLFKEGVVEKLAEVAIKALYKRAGWAALEAVVAPLKAAKLIFLGVEMAGGAIDVSGPPVAMVVRWGGRSGVPGEGVGATLSGFPLPYEATIELRSSDMDRLKEGAGLQASRRYDPVTSILGYLYWFYMDSSLQQVIVVPGWEEVPAELRDQTRYPYLMAIEAIPLSDAEGENLPYMETLLLQHADLVAMGECYAFYPLTSVAAGEEAQRPYQGLVDVFDASPHFRTTVEVVDWTPGAGTPEGEIEGEYIGEITLRVRIEAK